MVGAWWVVRVVVNSLRSGPDWDGAYIQRFLGTTDDHTFATPGDYSFAPGPFRQVDLGGDGLSDIYNRDEREVLRAISDDVLTLPTIAGLTIMANDPLTARRRLVATGVIDDTGVTNVNFFHDSNSDGVLGEQDTFIGNDSVDDGGGVFSRGLQGDLTYGGSGSQTFFARARDPFGFLGVAIAVEAVLAGPVEPQAIDPTVLGPATLALGGPTDGGGDLAPAAGRCGGLHRRWAAGP